MNVRIKFCGEVMARRENILLNYVPAKFSFADIFTKPLNTVSFRELRSVLLQDLSEIINNSKRISKSFAVLKDFLNSPR